MWPTKTLQLQTWSWLQPKALPKITFYQKICKHYQAQIKDVLFIKNARNFCKEINVFDGKNRFQHSDLFQHCTVHLNVSSWNLAHGSIIRQKKNLILSRSAWGTGLLTEAYHSRTSSMNLQYPLNILELGLEFSYTSKKNFCTFKNISECQLSLILWCDLLNKSCKTQLIINVIFFSFTVINLSISAIIYHVYILM